MKGKILLVEDDYALAMGTEYILQAEGYETLLAKNLKEARAYVKEDIQLILLDIMLPDGTGFDLCKEMRDADMKVPIIFLTAVGEEANIVRGLELGADDYITKPYRVKELVSRIAANIRRTEMYKKTDMPQYRFGEHVFDEAGFRLFYKEKQVDCTQSELKLLKKLIQNEGYVLTRNQLIENLWDVDEAFVDDNTLSVYMKRLRDKLGEDAMHIQTVRGVGYRFEK